MTYMRLRSKTTGKLYQGEISFGLKEEEDVGKFTLLKTIILSPPKC